MNKILVSLDFSYSFSREIWRGIVRYSFENTRWTLWPSDASKLKATEIAKYDGLIGFLNNKEEGDNYLQHLKCLVNVSNRDQGYQMPSVLNDDKGVGRMAAEYFIAKGFRSFAFFGQDMTYSQLRLEGFRQVIEEAKLPLKIHDSKNDNLQEWLRSLNVATAIFSCSDQKAFQLVRMCWELDIPIPQHLALLGVDNDETYCQSGIIGMSSVMLASETLGFRAAELLDRQLHGEVITKNPSPIAPLNIVTRLSTDMQAVNDELVRRALRFIHNNVHTNFQVEDLLGHLHVGRRTLERKFKEHLGHSPHFAINRARVEMAKRLLETTEFKMDDIAVRCGFSEARILYRNFRMITGESPARYRQHFR